MTIRIMKNNPAFLERDELIRGFVVRQADLKLLTERLHEHQDGPCQHILIIAPRGMGKTTLVLRTVADVQLDKSLAKKWYPIVFGEESYEVATAAEVWLEALGHLARQTRDTRWEDAYRKLKGERDEQRLYERALGRLMDFADEQQKKLLIVIENLNMILGEQLNADDGWTLRHTLQNESRIMMLATATSRFDEIDNADKAMYDLFWTIPLEPLNKDECRTVWRALTGHELKGDRIRPVEILTGGSPRLLSILGSFASEMSLRELMRNLAHLVDEHTSYFKSNLESLPVAERKVYVTLADIWSPATAREVAEAARIDINKASASLHRLMTKGAVSEVGKEGRTIRYQVTERLYNIYHLMRKHGGDESRVHAVVEFMIGLYEQDDIIDVIRTIADEACSTDPDVRRDHFFVYGGVLERLGNDVRAKKILAVTNPQFFQFEDAPDFIKELPKKLTEPTAEHATEDQRDAEIRQFLDTAWEHWRAGRRDDAEAAVQEVFNFEPDNWAASFILMMIAAQQGRQADAETLASKLTTALPTTFVADYVAAVVRAAASDFGEARPYYERAIQSDPENGALWFEYGSICSTLQDWSGAETAYTRAASLDENNAETWLRLSSAQGNLGKHAAAASSARCALRINPDDVRIWRNLAWALLDQEQFTEECEDAIRRGISADVDDNHAPFHMALRLQDARIQTATDARAEAKRYDQFESGSHFFLATLALNVIRRGWISLLAKAESWARDAVTKVPSARYFRITLALVLGVRNQWDEALSEAKQTLDSPEFAKEMQPFIQWFFVVAAGTGHVADSLAMLSSTPVARELEPLVTALQMLEGQSPNVPYEVLEMAKDIVKQVEAIRAKLASTTPPATEKTPAKRSKSKK